MGAAAGLAALAVLLGLMGAVSAMDDPRTRRKTSGGDTLHRRLSVRLGSVAQPLPRRPALIQNHLGGICHGAARRLLYFPCAKYVYDAMEAALVRPSRIEECIEALANL